jgi:pyruvate/2-oxoglutarate dehydrogenase complex dihydrolipoamide dehydrogenase (E3) component
VREEPFAGEQVAAALRELGVDVRTGAEAVRVERRRGAVDVELADGGRLQADQLLVAIGRRPLTEDIGLDTVGLEPGAPIDVDDTMQVAGRDWLYAIGDVNGRALLTHMGKYQARIAAANVLGGEDRVARSAQGPLAPRVVFTDPQVAAVGHTLESARGTGIAAVAVDHPTRGSAASSFYGRGAPGTTRHVFDADRDVLVGATFVGPEVAEMVHAATIAIVGEVPAARLAHAIPSFPTRSEIWLRLLDKYEAVARPRQLRAVG